MTQVTSQATTNNLLKARTQHATQDGTMTKIGLLKSGKLMNRWNDRTVKPVVCPQGGARAQQFIIGDEETELDLSLGSR